jgi:hypothetical protein
MTFFNNDKHFLHKHLSFLESTEILGKDGGFTNFLLAKGIQAEETYWDVDHSTISWDVLETPVILPPFRRIKLTPVS